MAQHPLPLADARAHLRADCSRCAGLCCVAPVFAASADFAIDKPAGVACLDLADDFRCGIHAELRNRGFPGCTVFDCFGAGQRITQETFGGRTWRQAPELAAAQLPSCRSGGSCTRRSGTSPRPRPSGPASSPTSARFGT